MLRLFEHEADEDLLVEEVEAEGGTRSRLTTNNVAASTATANKRPAISPRIVTSVER
jgi:hypothetical protein